MELDPEMAATLLDQKDGGKMLLLITNSDYEYTARMVGLLCVCGGFDCLGVFWVIWVTPLFSCRTPNNNASHPPPKKYKKDD